MVRARLSPSCLLTATLTLVHCAAAATVFPLDVRPEYQATLITLVIASLGHALYHYALLRSSRSIIELEIHDREKAAIKTQGTDWRDARILCTSCVTPSLTVLNLRIARSRFARHVLLVRDNVNSDEFRTIRVLLRWARPRGEPGSDPEEAGA